MGLNRDGFKIRTIETLAKRVGYLCSNPTCRKLTIGANENLEKSTSIGIAAHITAASIGGPRYDGNFTPAQRSHIDNGIWLCSNCASLIDKDEMKYSVELLKMWKQDAEEESKKKLSGQIINQPKNTQHDEIHNGFKKESIKLKFRNGTELVKIYFTPLLEAFYQEVNRNELKDILFSDKQIIVETDEQYDYLKAKIENSSRIDVRRLIVRLERYLVEGTVIILNYAYLKDKQIDDTYQACFGFARAIRNWIIWSMRDALDPEEMQNTDYGKHALESPLLGMLQNIEAFYNARLIKVDLWHPGEELSKTISIYLRKDGFAGSWFSATPQLSGPYNQHYSPNDFYNFILPQMVMRHLVNKGKIIEDWTGYHIGCA